MLLCSEQEKLVLLRVKSGALDEASEGRESPLASRSAHWHFSKFFEKVPKTKVIIGLPAAEISEQGTTTPATEKRVKTAKDLTISWLKKGENWKGRVSASRESDPSSQSNYSYPFIITIIQCNTNSNNGDLTQN